MLMARTMTECWDESCRYDIKKTLNWIKITVVLHAWGSLSLVRSHPDAVYPNTLCMLNDMPPSTNKRELQSSLGIMNYFGRFSSATSVLCDVYMEFYNEKEPLYLKTNALSIGIGAGLLQAKDLLQLPYDEVPDSIALCPEAFARRSLTNM